MVVTRHDERPVNLFAITGLIASVLLVSVLGLVFGHVALAQIHRTGARGRGLAIAAVVIGYVGVLIGFVMLAYGLVLLGGLFTQALCEDQGMCELGGPLG